MKDIENVEEDPTQQVLVDLYDEIKRLRADKYEVIIDKL
jgi:hypothetical protein